MFRWLSEHVAVLSLVSSPPQHPEKDCEGSFCSGEMAEAEAHRQGNMEAGSQWADRLLEGPCRPGDLVARVHVEPDSGNRCQSPFAF